MYSNRMDSRPSEVLLSLQSTPASAQRRTVEAVAVRRAFFASPHKWKHISWIAPCGRQRKSVELTRRINVKINAYCQGESPGKVTGAVINIHRKLQNYQGTWLPFFCLLFSLPNHSTCFVEADPGPLSDTTPQSAIGLINWNAYLSPLCQLGLRARDVTLRCSAICLLRACGY